MELSAFQGWQTNISQGYKKSFGSYLRTIGLKYIANKKYKITEEMKKAEIEKAKNNSKVAILALKRKSS